jgi:hypothetical protein
MHGVDCIRETIEMGIDLRLTGALAKKPTSTLWKARPTAGRMNRRANNVDYVNKRCIWCRINDV